ncbi:MAG: hypothetical protein K6T91_05655 [Firmicutes bacterium]|nr:hypothetical protein [Bacillota bacterium]
MRLFNRVLATIVSLFLIIGSAVGIIYLVGILTGVTAFSQLGRSIIDSLARLSAGQIQGIVAIVFVLSLMLFILEVRPWRARFITVRDDERGKTQVFRSDLETYLVQRIAQKKTISPEHLDIITHGNRFVVVTDVAASSTADPQAVQKQVEQDIRRDLETIGLDEDLEQISTRISRVKRVA